MRRLEVSLLGTFAVHLDGEPVTEFGYDKVRALLAYLVIEGRRPQRRDTLVGLLWSEQPQRDALANLRNALARLRALLHDRDAALPFLLVTHESVQLHPEADVAADAARFIELAALCRAHGHAAGVDCPECARALNEAVALYRGELLPGFTPDSEPFEAWLRVQREALHAQALELLECLAVQAEAQGAYDQVLVHARRQLQLEPWNERAHRQAMRALALTGHRTAALAQYQTCCETLSRELGAEPELDTLELHEQVRSGEFLRTPGAARRVRERIGEPVGPCPYRGLQAFSETDVAFFFGRDAFVDRLMAAVTAPPHIVAVVGASGSGKSSVVHAGLLPRLRASGEWVIALLRPGREPFQALAGALEAHLEPTLHEIERLVQVRRLGELLERGELPLADVVARLRKRHRGSTLLLVDQFEELYTLCPDPGTRERFIDTLLDTVRVRETSDQERAPVALALALRADFMGQVLTHRPFADALQTAAQMLGPMTREELREVIEKPAASQGAVLEAGLVERLLNDVSRQPGNLPLLEFALTLLWDNLDRGWLTHAAYDAIGQVQGALTRYAQEVYEGLNEADRALCRRAFTQLVQPGEGTEDTRRVATRAEVGEAGWTLVQHLADRRLVVTARDPLTGDETVEVVHEALIWSWQQLQAWMDEDRAFRAWQERLRVALRTWEATGADEGTLLRGAPLVEAEDWLAERSEELSAGEQGYIRTSAELRDLQEQEREARRQRELAAAEQLAEQRRLSAARLRRSALYLSLALLVALAAATLAGVFGRRSANLARDNLRIAEQEAAAHASAQAEAEARATAQAQAEEQREEALRQAAIGLASEAALQMQGPEQELALLLALEAVERYPYTWQAELALGEVVRDFRLVKELGHGTAAGESPSLSPDGTRLLSTAEDCFLRVWDVESGANLLTVPVCHPVGGTAVRGRWSPSGDRILTTSYEGIPKLWDAQTGELLHALTGHGGLTADWSPDGTRVLSYASREDDAAVIWNAETGEALHRLPGDQGTVVEAQFSPDGTRVVTSLGQIWDAQTGRLRHTFTAYQDALTRESQLPVGWSPDGAAVGSGIGELARVWDAATGEELLVLRTGYQGRTKLWWSPDGALLLTVSLDEVQAPIVWDAATGRQLRQLPHAAQATPRTTPWSGEGGRIALRDDQSQVTLWDAATGRELLRLPVHEHVSDVSWLPGGDRFLTSYIAGTARIWQISTAPLKVGCAPNCRLDQHWSNLGGFGRRPAWSPDGTRVTRHYAYGLVRVWDARTGEEVLHLQQADRADMGAIGWSPDGSRLLTLTSPTFGTNGELEIWDATTGESLGIVAEGCGGWEARWSPEGERIVTYGFGAPATVWDVATGEALVQYTEHDPWIAEWSPDGTRIASGDGWTKLGPVRVWDVQTGRTLLTLLPDDHPYGTSGLAWSPDGTRIAVFSGPYGTMWDAETGDLLGTMAGPPEAYSVEWSPAGTRVLVGSQAGIRVYDATSLQQIMTYPTSFLAWGAWSPDGTSIAITTFNGDLTIYPAWESLETLVAYARECCAYRDLTPAERERYGLPAVQVGETP